MLKIFASLILILALASCSSLHRLPEQQEGVSGEPVLQPLPTDLEPKYQQGLKMLENGEANTLDYWQSLSQEYPTYPGIWTNLGVALSLDKQYKQAVEAYDKAIVIDPGYCSVYNLKGVAERELGLFDSAEQSYRESINCDPKNGFGYYNMGVLKDLYQNDLSTALMMYRKARKLLPDEESLNVWVIDLARRTSQAEEDPAEVDSWYSQLIKPNTHQISPEQSVTPKVEAEDEQP